MTCTTKMWECATLQIILYPRNGERVSRLRQHSFFFSVRDAIVAYSGVKCFIQRQSKGEGARDGLLAAKPLPYFNSAADVEEGRRAGARRAAAV